MSGQSSPEIFVIGTASLDILHLANGQTVPAAGGAGMYTALAAWFAGARAGLFAPRPDPLPKPLEPVAQYLRWIGPVISGEELPRLEIEHHGRGQATLLHASWGAEAQFVPAIMPAEVFAARVVHIAALSTAERQLAFLHTLKDRLRPLVSVGTYARLVYGETEQVQQLLAQADLFFMNENEANGLFGRLDQAQTRSGALLFITLGENGVLVVEGGQQTHIPAQPVTELDPTGAGDSFCGATLAGLVQGKSPVAAAQEAVIVAAQTVSAIGPAALLAGQSQ